MLSFNENDVVVCVQLSKNNVEKLVLGKPYRVTGVMLMEGGVEVYSYVDLQGNVVYATSDYFTRIEYVSDNEIKKELEREMKQELETAQVNDPVNHPAHYNFGKFEILEVILEVVKGLPPDEAYLVGQIIKYIGGRYRRKEKPIQDVKKAQFYMDKLVEVVESNGDFIVVDGEEYDPTQHPITKKQIGYIAGLTKSLRIDRYDLPSYLSDTPNYKELSEFEASNLIDRLLSIKSWKEVNIN